jgi:hypothetical protein
VVGAVLIDQLDLCVADFIVGARPVFGCSGRGSIGTANGDFSNVVNEGDSLKELAVVGKQTRGRMDENHQMRDILVTPAIIRRRQSSGPGRDKAQAPVPQAREGRGLCMVSVDGSCVLNQTAGE